MESGPPDLAQVRLDNAMRLFEEFVRATARHADAATLRGLERRFAERVQIQPSYWSQIKSRSRQIGERLARQFEHLMHKPRGWMDLPHGGEGSGPADRSAAGVADVGAGGESESSAPRDDDERFIIGLVLTYYRRHPQRARARLLDLLGEVLVPADAEGPRAGSPGRSVSPVSGQTVSGGGPRADDEQALWLRTRSGVAPLKPRK
ncbi:MAG: hypothetical protein JNN03_19960 [Rubrivivax sp.]|nr:hypothetical protein [Rubrivivax sp.]